MFTQARFALFTQARFRCRAFTLLELLVVLAILAVLVALLLSALQAAREMANQLRCQSNLRQLGTAVHTFHDINHTMPPYFGIYPRVSGGADYGGSGSANKLALYGGWFAHLLPYVEQQNLYDQMMQDIKAAQYNSFQQGALISPATLISPAVPGSGSSTTVVPTTVIRNGYAYTYQRSVQTWQTPPKAAVYAPAVYAPAAYHGIWMDGAYNATFRVLQCPSDLSSGPDAADGRVYLRSSAQSRSDWGSTNYEPNWNAWGDGDVAKGWWTPPQRFSAITDGLSQTILFGEAYAWCDGVGRIALYPPNQQTFGLSTSFSQPIDLTDQLSGTQLTVPARPTGWPNQTMFQVRPQPYAASQCPAGTICCDNWAAQTGHAAMNVGMADGSVQAIHPSISATTWTRLLLPRDGETPGMDW